MFNALRPMINIEDLATRPGVGGNYRDDIHFQNQLGDTRSSAEIIEHTRRCDYTPIIRDLK